MKTPMRTAAIVSAAPLAALGAVPAAEADQPDREVFTLNSDDELAGSVFLPGSTAGDGDGHRDDLPGFRRRGPRARDRLELPGTLTNLGTGDHLSIAYPGALHITYYADGSHTTRGTGANLITPPVPIPATGALGLWLVRGQFQFQVAPDGTIAASTLTGTQHDLCDELSP